MSGNSQEQHEMRLERTHPSGAEEWFCPTCRRRFVIEWSPAYKRIVLTAGDEWVVHSGGKGDLQMGPPQMDQDQAPDFPNNLRIALERLLENVDFDSWPSTAD
jgi:hypothetical protein